MMAAEQVASDIAIWGLPGSGKTTLIGMLRLESENSRGEWEVQRQSEATPSMEALIRQLADGQFPAATPVGTLDTFQYRVIHRPTGRVYSMSLTDMPGKDWAERSPAARETFRQARGLVFLFEPNATREQMMHGMEALDAFAGVVHDDRPVALCLCKADLNINSRGSLNQAKNEPDFFVRRACPDLKLDEVFGRFRSRRLFPVSAVGVRSVGGGVETASFYDQNLEVRFQPGAERLLMAPFAWLFSELEKR